MKTGSTSTLILLEMIYVTLLPALNAQTVSVLPVVTGYLRHDVTLPCHFIKASVNDTVTQVQWNQLEPEEKTIVVFKPPSDLNIPVPALKEKVELTEQSLIIKAVELEDAGLYRCVLSTFPSGSFEGTTKLIVREQLPLSSGEVSAIVIAVILLVGSMAAITYFFFIRRCDSSVSHSVFSGGTVMDVSKSSGIERAEDVVYSGVKLKPLRGETTSSNDEHRRPSNADVTYADVMILGRKPK
ncbi:nectin-3-like protein isoform X2 [Platichthys flesus]|uniref:nectin-3-like protein isoform X2 n=1 Tax=Platichthys flesus TaxID=8260 RepID=UPI002DB681B6|nr:nectin-3-like protein isoform X2 [Platichthys flesus]